VGSPVSLTYYFSDSAPSYAQSSWGYTNASAQAWTASQKSTVEQALAGYASVAGLSFTPVASQAQTDISFFLSTSLTVSGFANSPGDASVNGTVAGDVYFQTDSFPADGSNLYLAFHETGHALGLAHPYDGGSKPTIESFGLNGSRLFSVVDQRLTEKPYYLYLSADGSSGGYNYIFNPTGPMLLDIAGLQALYGPNNATGAGDTTYSFDVNPNFYKTIWDGGGHDTIDVSNQVNSSLISLVPGTYSTIGLRDPFVGFPAWLTTWVEQSNIPKSAFNNGANSLTIAFGTVIEDVIGSAAPDILIGNSAANMLSGGGGNDTLTGGAGADTLDGGTEDDFIDGGDDADTAVYAGARASYVVTATADGFTIASAASGTDTLKNVEWARFSDQTISLLAPDTTPPAVASFSPADGATGVPIASNIVVTFNEAVQKGIGNIELRSGSAAGPVVETFEAATSTRLTVSDTTLTIVPTSSLANSTHYFVTFVAGSVKDVAGNDFVGTANYDFTTTAYVNSAPSGSVTITGTVTQGQTLSAANSLADIDGLGTITYQWNVAGNAISGATNSTFVVTEAEVGKAISVTASYTDGHGTLETVTGNAGKTADLLAYIWKAHTLLDGVSVSAGVHSGTTDATGATSFTAITDPSLTLTASRAVPTAEAVATASAVNLQDAIAILKMIVGLPVNGANQALSPYQALAADFDGKGTVGLTDAIGVLKHVVGLTAPEPTWHFVNATDVDLATISISPLEPGGPPVITADLGGSSPVQVELVGYLSGDVDGSFA